MEHITAVEHIQADVVVLGTGGAGMAAAVTAAEAGAKVVILEKRPFPGGASNTPVGFCLPGSPIRASRQSINYCAVAAIRLVKSPHYDNSSGN